MSYPFHLRNCCLRSARIVSMYFCMDVLFESFTSFPKQQAMRIIHCFIAQHLEISSLAQDVDSGPSRCGRGKPSITFLVREASAWLPVHQACLRHHGQKTGCLLQLVKIDKDQSILIHLAVSLPPISTFSSPDSRLVIISYLCINTL